MGNKIYNRTNFHRHTFCVFKEVDATAIENLKTDYKSKSGSLYYFTNDGVFRQSNHWGRAANCKWRLENKVKKSDSRNKIGFAFWTDFFPDNDFEKLYYIDVNFKDKTATYFHKNHNLTNNNAIFRTAGETTKVIKIIRNLFNNDAWAKHFETNEIEEIRKKMIQQLIETNLSLHQIKSQFLTNL